MRSLGLTLLERQLVQMNGREQRRRRWGAPRAMLLAGAPLAARQAQRNLARLRAARQTTGWPERARAGGE